MSEGLINYDEVWGQIEQHAIRVMGCFDTLPPAVQKAIRDTGVDDISALKWLRHLKCPEATAIKLRELATMAHEQEMASAAAALARTPRSSPAARRRP